MSSWTHPVCDPCWQNLQPGREPARFRDEARQAERCCWCGQKTRSGIYAWKDPGRIPNHKEHE